MFRSRRVRTVTAVLPPGLLALCTLLLPGCAEQAGVSPQGPDPRVAALADEAWADILAQAPALQARRGDLLGELPDLTVEAWAEDAARAKELLERVAALEGEALVHEDELTLAVLRWDAEQTVAQEPCLWLQFPVTPYQAGQNLALLLREAGEHPFTEESHVENYLVFLAEFGDLLDQLDAHLAGQEQRDIRIARAALPGIVGLFRSYGAQAGARLPLEGGRLDALPPELADYAVSESRRLVEERLLPGFEAVASRLDSEAYRAAAPEAVGLSQYEGGEACYRALVRRHTTMEVTPEELHQLGLEQLEAIEARLAAIRAELGFEGSREEFEDSLRQDPRFYDATPEAVAERFQGYMDRMEPVIDQLFHARPEAPYGTRRLDEAAEATMTFGYYQPPTPDEPVGLYRFNGSRLDERPMIWAGPLIWHELAPGHHFQIASQLENVALGDYRREALSGGAFIEGWGNYAAALGDEAGLLEDPYERYGAALFDAFLSMRLVVDTGFNLYGWSLEDGRRFMTEHTFQSPTEVATESLRYSTDLFGQALSYKAGLLKILELRDRARELAGDDFDIRDFHDAVLSPGALPLVVLEDHVRWRFGGGAESRRADAGSGP